MTRLPQTLIVLKLSIANIRERAGASIAIVISIACITGVLLSTLTFANSIVRGFLAEGDPARALVLPAGTLFEGGSGLPKNIIGTILDAPGIAKDADGKPLADGEITESLNTRQGENKAFLELRGVGPAGLALRPELKIVAGRWFHPGRREVVIGAAASRTQGIKVGDTVLMRDGKWPVVGVFTGRGIQESGLLADADTVMTALSRTGFSSVVARLESPKAFAAFSQWLADNPALKVTAQTQAAYSARIANGQSRFFVIMAWLAGSILSIGALLGGVNVLYSVVASREREMAMLRAVGYQAFPVASSVVLETMILCLAGAFVGACGAWALFDGREIIRMGTVFELSVSPSLFGLALAWAAMFALLGSALPAIRAGRQTVAEALRVV